MVGDRDRAEAAVAGGLEQHLDRRRAVRRVVGVHVQVDLDQRPPGDPPPRLARRRRRRGGGRRAAGRSPRTRRRPRPSRAPPRRLRPPRRAREVALEQLGGRRGRHRAGVEAAEEDLDQRPRHLGREDPLLGRVEGGDVERVGVAQRRRGDPRRERLVDVDDVAAGAAASRFFTESPEPRTDDLVAAPPELLGDGARRNSLTAFRVPRRCGRDLGYRETLSRHPCSI